jgi:hypothetical protein
MSNRIRELNDAFRMNPAMRGKLMLTHGVANMENGFADKAIKAVQEFTAFDQGNDPYSEHDFISVEVDGETVFAKIEYYDRTLQYGSPNPEDPAVTTRVMTVMLADEY